MTDLDQFALDLQQEVLARADREDAELPISEAFTEYMIEELCAAGVLEDGETAPHKQRGMAVSGYSLADDGAVLDLLVSVHNQLVPPAKVTNPEIDAAVRRGLKFFEFARDVKEKSLKGLEESTAAFDMVLAIRDSSETLRKLRVVVITDGIAALREREHKNLGEVEVLIDV